VASAPWSQIAPAEAQKRGASLSQVPTIRKGIPSNFGLHHIEQADELITDKASKEAEEYSKG